MRKDIAFRSEDGITLRGWHYVPEEWRGKVPTYRHGARLLGG